MIVDVAVRGLGYGIIHAARVSTDDLHDASLMGADFIGVWTPVIARCGVTIRSVQPAVVVMRDAAVSCRGCERAILASILTAWPQLYK